MIKDPKWRKKMIKHLNHRRERHRKGIEVGKHLSEGEKKATELTHPKTISLLKEVLNDIQQKRGRALDAGCGDGRLAKYLLALEFDKVDMFDPCPKGVAIAQELAEVNPVIDRVDQETFQSYVFNHKYDAIFMTWSAGYVDDNELVRWLKRAKLNLNNKRNARSSP